MNYEPGKSYEEINVGDEASFSKTITETDVTLFAAITGDFNPVHMNEEYAKTGPFKARIAHGGITECLIAPVLGTLLPGLGTVVVEIKTRFKAPTFIGDTITATGKVVEKIEAKKWVRMELTYTNQGGQKVCAGETVIIPPKK